MSRLLLLACAAPILLASFARAGGVRIVEPTGTQNFADIASAVAAAADGDVLLVAPGTYSGFSIAGKSLSLFAVPGATVTVQGPVSVSALTSSQTVVLSGISVVLDSYSTATPLVVTGCAGHVRVERGMFKAYDQTVNFCPPPALVNGAPGVQVVSSSKVAFSGCTITGGRGEGLDGTEPPGCAPAADGGSGLAASDSTVVLYDCTTTGGEGGGSEGTQGRGGVGLLLPTGAAFASAGSFRGGRGGANYSAPPSCGGPGGDGCVLSGSSTLTEIGCSFVAGPPGYPGCGTFGLPVSGGSPSSLPGPARRATIGPSVASDLGSWSVGFQGASGDQAYLLASLPPGFQISLPFHGAWLALRSALLPVTFLGIADGAGALSAASPTPDLPAGSLLQRRFAQVATRSSGQVYLGSAAVLLLLDRDSGPDCNGNGTSDYLDVIEGTSADANHNLVPDPCEMAGPPWYVDDSAAPGGNGSAASPFQAMGQAFAAAFDGHTILVADGLYVGPGNRDLDFAGRNLVVRSQNGPANCVIDCQNAGRAFYVNWPVTAAGRIEGFTIRNGQAFYGGGIYVHAASPTIENCILRGCRANQIGGALMLDGGSSLVRGCSFIGNQTTNAGGGGGAIHFSAGGAPRILNCLVAGNQAAIGGGLALVSTSTVVVPRIVGCTIRDNVATSWGGGIAADGGYFSGLAHVTGCLIAGNRAAQGGGAGSGFGNPFELQIDDTTIVDNTATSGGGALFATSGGKLTVRNCVLDSNAAPVGPEIFLEGNFGSATAVASDLRGGASAVSVCANSTFVLGPGTIDADPLFVDPDGADNQPTTIADNDYRLAAGSPCLDAGDNTLVPADAADVDGDGNTSEPLPLDLDGAPRFVDDPAPDTGIGTPPIVDMGCYERHP